VFTLTAKTNANHSVFQTSIHRLLEKTKYSMTGIIRVTNMPAFPAESNQQSFKYV
jgi:hypothetical protein